MFSDSEILKIGKNARIEFNKKHKVKCKIITQNLDEFWRLAKKSRIVQQEMKLGLPLKIGSLTVHGKNSTIILNKEIINSLTKNSNFIKALVMHELYHIYLNNKVNTTKEAFESEEEDKKVFAKEFPKYSKLLKP